MWRGHLPKFFPKGYDVPFAPQTLCSLIQPALRWGLCHCSSFSAFQPTSARGELPQMQGPNLEPQKCLPA